MDQRRNLSREFKLAAVKKIVAQGLLYREVARQLKIRDTYIHNWKNAFEADGTLQVEASKGSNVEAELKRLREENRKLKLQRDILKKSMGILSES